MKGQWLGELAGPETAGLVVLDLEDLGVHYGGSAFYVQWEYFDQKDPSPGTYLQLRFPKLDEVEFEADLFPVAQNGALLNDAQMAARFPNWTHGHKAKISLRRTGEWLHVSYATDTPASGAGRLYRARGDAPSAVPAAVRTWDEFRNQILELPPRRFIFRGQYAPKRLRTTFHRYGRSDLLRFVTQDVEECHKALTPLTNHYYDFKDPKQFGAFLGLMQHHGYPTPFLDWTYSPFIAAFFAFRNECSDEVARIFVFDVAAWCDDYIQNDRITFIPPHFSFTELMNVENARAGPQQAVSTATNIDDIEHFVSIQEKRRDKSYLTAIDIPHSERGKILAELSLMGITAASLMPGLDGACEMLKHRMFGYV